MKRHGAPGVYVHAGVQDVAAAANDDAIANIGFIVGGTAVMVIDPGSSAVEGAALREAVEAATEKPSNRRSLASARPTT